MEISKYEQICLLDTFPNTVDTLEIKVYILRCTFDSLYYALYSVQCRVFHLEVCPLLFDLLNPSLHQGQGGGAADAEYTDFKRAPVAK